MNDRQFREELESATLTYQPRFRADDRPVVVSLNEGGESPAAHALLCGLVNQLARTHRRLVLVGDLERPLLCHDPFGKQSLAEASAGNALEINPVISVDVVERAPQSEAVAHISIGGDAGMALGCEGWRALTGQGAQVGEDIADLWGAMLASTLGAWFAFSRLLGEEPSFGESYSLWHYGEPEGQDGPHLNGLPELGQVLQVGAGGVGASLDYWLAMLGLTGALTIVDADRVEVPNLNRQLIFTASDAGYPDGAMKNKAERAAARLGPRAVAEPRWYGETDAVVRGEYDVVLALANEHGAREALQDRRSPVLLHATTSPNHQAQFHRHLPGRDDCIRCRLPGATAQTACATAPATDEASDAALPYLSGLAGLMLAAALARHGLGELAASDANLAVVDLGGTRVAHQAMSLRCEDNCGSRAN